MLSLTDFVKYKLAPPKLYLAYSATRKYKRARKKGELELHLLPFLADPKKAAIDIGANKGLYTHYLAKLCKSVIAFEPQQELAEFLKRATPPNVTVINKGLSNRSSIEEFHIPLIKGRKSRNISTLEPELVADYETIIRKVEILPLDEFDYKDIGFIKIDVEGHELSVLKGAQKTIERSRPVIQVEILADQATLKDHQVIRFLSEAGYDMMSLQNNLLRLYKPSETITSSRNFIFLPQSG